jgi:colanic acid/amylovoran biosynthesis glycosyltransferase
MAVKDKTPSVLILISGLPDENSFLVRKFVGLDKYMKVDIIAWDPSKNRKRHKEALKAEGFSGNIYLSPTKFSISTLFLFLLVNFPFFFLKFRTIIRFIKQGRKLIGNSIYKRLFFDFYFVRSQHDIWHLEFGAGSAWYYFLKEIFPQKKLSVSFRGYDLNYVGLASNDYYTQVWKYFDGFHFLGADLKKRAIKRGYAVSRVEAIIPPAIDTAFFSPNGKDAQRPPDKLIVVSVGRLVWKKGFEYGVRAMALLKEKGIPFEYRIIGDGDFLQPIEFTIAELGLQDNVKLLGKMSAARIKDQLNDAHVFLHPAISEGFCNSVLEAQAMGLPVICTDADGLPENIVDNETGFVVSKWDVHAMADKLEWCYDNKAQAKLMGAKGVERVTKYFKLEDQITSFVSFYQKLHDS